jgi:preprotein translocase subunit SecG
MQAFRYYKRNIFRFSDWMFLEFAMSTVGIILLVAFVIICIVLVFVVMIQNEEEGMGGLFGSNTSTAFGSHSASVLTKTTFVLVTLFIVTSFVLAMLNKKPAVQKDLSGVASEVQQTPEGTSTQPEWWKNTAPATTAPETSPAPADTGVPATTPVTK